MIWAFLGGMVIGVVIGFGMAALCQAAARK